MQVSGVPAIINADATTLNGYEILNHYFDELFATNPAVYAFGEDLGNIGDVNQGFAGLQIKHGADRIFDTGIREQSIMGHAPGMAMRGLRPIAEIQYLDYLLYGLQTLSDDVATLHYRSNGLQSSPVIIRTRGHRLEGIFHSGSPMGVIINALRGMFICVPRNMVQAVGMYNTLLAGNDPALLIECLNGYEILNHYFDELFASNPLVYAFGEDLGNIGDVNQGFAGLQIKYGADRIFDTGIREQSIMGQAHGMALRGLRPIAEIQYLDYLLYGLQTLSDDVATLHYRSNGIQSSPVIIRTRGHRLEGIFHSGSPMGVIINALRGMYICVPRNMVQAVGMYNTLLAGNDPALLIECLNGYRLKEQMPTNLMSFKVPLGVPEIIREGNDITIVSYGSTIRIIEDAAIRLSEMGIDCEIIDVQTLLPFDIHHQILASLKKTNRIVFVDEDVPGGGSAYMYQQVLEVQGGYKWLDATARTISAKAHRPAYASDGDYFSKPNTEEIIEKIKEMMAE